MRTSTPRLVLLLILLLSFIAGCAHSTCNQLAETRASFNVALNGLHLAHTTGAVTAAQEKVAMPYILAVDKALTAGEDDCIAEQKALQAGDKPTAETLLSRAKTYLKAAGAGMSAFDTVAPQAKAQAKIKASTQPTH